MPKIPGADARPSRTLQSLDRFTPEGMQARFTPEGIQAWATVGLVLSEAINDGRLVVNARLSPSRRESASILIEWLYVLQDALHGSNEPLPAALASFIRMAESGANHG